MLLKTVTSFNGQPLNGTNAVAAELWVRETTFARTTAAQYTQRRNAPGVAESLTPAPTRIVLMVTARDPALPRAAFTGAVERVFALSVDPSPRVLRGLADDGTEIALNVLVVGLELVRDSGPAVTDLVYRVTCEANEPAWASADTTGSGAAVTNEGPLPVAPRASLTTATHVTRRACTVAHANGGDGLVSYPVKFTTSVNMTLQNTYVYVEGVSVPCLRGNGYVWALVDTAGDGAATAVDLVYGAGAGVNPLQDTLDLGGLDPSTSTNNVWTYNNLVISDNPQQAGAWRPAAAGRSMVQNGSFGLTAESEASITFARATDGTYLNDADSMTAHFGNPLGAGPSAFAVTRTLAGMGAGTLGFLRGRVKGSARWIDLWTSAVNGTTSTTVNPQGCVQLVAGVEYTASNATTAPSITLSALQVTFAAAPTVTVGAVETMDSYTGTLAMAPNRLLGAEDFSAGYWANYQLTVTANAANAPNGTLTADALVEAATAGTHGNEQTITVAVAAGQTWTFQVALRARERTRAQLSLAVLPSYADLAKATVDLELGTVVATSVGMATVTDLGDGWRLCTVTGAAPASGTGLGVYITLVSTGETTSYTGDGASGLYAWGAQLEAGGQLTPWPGPSVTFAQLIAPNGTLTLDAEARTLRSSAAGPLYGGLSFSDPAQWLSLAPGVNAVTNTTGGTAAFTWRGRRL